MLAVVVEAVDELLVSVEEDYVRCVAVRGQRVVGHQAGGDAVFGGALSAAVLARMLAKVRGCQLAQIMLKDQLTMKIIGRVNNSEQTHAQHREATIHSHTLTS